MHSLDEVLPQVPATHTAVIVAVAAAEAVVGRHREELDRSAGWGIPAHVTVLYPFLAPDALTTEAVATLAAAIGSVPAFDATFAATAWFGSDILWLAPEPDEPFRHLVDAVWRAFPQCPPYGGVHDDVVPHLTVADRALATGGQMAAAEAAVRSGLPIHQRVDHALLVAGTSAPRSWRTVKRLPLG
ncbi:2'-5' RNA ligase family protein [Cellulomonas rhizosphaerae]|uniref:2'-5' RNA ligase family protein n=1 Tax=Cellulomonas rhizosphaerae TaxID=2293719 RepID=A0A413RJL3_9CELL|nr:2'-5' RNA ligase family protein [Cellulomonas rhizosphaerae]RHA38820.1 2'-5' RNA ligase family protein [Cellulomonas rhizosphaerae]